jgi:dolichol-phosphate mannosyltransferase
LLSLGEAKSRIEVSNRASPERISIILPVLNEAERIAPCLAGLVAQPEEVQEILVVDGGSVDGTQAIVERFHSRDQRVRLVDASPIDERWTGKAWGLHIGLQHSSTSSDWILCIDADVTVAPELVRSLLNHAQKTEVATFSVATSQRLSGRLAGLIHPAMLATLIYRFGSPGKASSDRHRVQANGQCFLSRRETLLRWQAFRAAQSSLCEDITIVRRLADCGETIGFYEADGLVEVSMYKDWRETWDNWPRSLPMRDQYFGWREALGLLGILLIQALPLPLFISAIIFAWPLWFLLLSGLLVSIRIGVLVGMARAYPQRPWNYWLSPLADLPVVMRIIQFALRRRHQWRGRTYVRSKGGTFEPLGDARRR